MKDKRTQDMVERSNNMHFRINQVAVALHYLRKRERTIVSDSQWKEINKKCQD